MHSSRHGYDVPKQHLEGVDFRKACEHVVPEHTRCRIDAQGLMRYLQKHPLGNSTAEVTALGFGAAPLGNLFAVVSEKDALAALDQAWSAGIRYFDTAPYYGYGTSEHRVGTGLATRPRDAFCLSTKVGRLLRAGVDRAADNEFSGTFPIGAVFDYGYDAAWRSVEESLRRLTLERVDVALLHDLDPTVHEPDAFEQYVNQALSGACRALEEMRQTEVVSAIGLGINDVRTALRFVREVALDVVLLAGRYTLLEHQSAQPLFDECERRNISVVIGSPFNSGVLAGDVHSYYDYAPSPPTVRARVEQLRVVCARHDVSLGAAALQFPFGRSSVVAVIPGVRDAEQVRENVKWLNAPIPTAMWEELRAQGLLADEVPVPSSP